MPLPHDDDDRPIPFAAADQGASSGDSVPPPAPPVMRSPYRPDEQLAAEAAQHRQQLRFPSLHHGSGHDAGQKQLPPPPPVQQQAQGFSSGSAGGGTGEGEFRPLPPQFSFRPETQPAPPPPPAAGSKGGRGVPVGVWAGAAVLVAVAVVAGVLVIGGKGSKGTITSGPTPSAGTSSHASTTTTDASKNLPAAWQAPATGDAATVVGSWLVDGKTVVRGDSGALKAYDAETGRALWAFTPPGPGASICAMSQSAAPKTGMVEYGPNGNCTTLAAVNTDDGKPLWTTPLAVPPGSPAGSVPAMSFGGDMVVGQVGTSLTAWNAADGKPLWTIDSAKLKPVCQLGQFVADGASLALIEDCGAGPVVTMKDSHTGKDLWQTPLPPDGLKGGQITLVQAVNPTVVHVASKGAQPVDRYYTFDPQGKLQAPIQGSGDYGQLDLTVGPQGQSRQQAHIQDTKFVAPTVEGDATTSLVAFDLVSGGKLWQAPATASGPLTVLATDQNAVTLFERGTPGSPARLMTFEPSGDKQPTFFSRKRKLDTDWTGVAAAVYLSGDRLIVLPTAPVKGSDVLAFTVTNS